MAIFSPKRMVKLMGASSGRSYPMTKSVVSTANVVTIGENGKSKTALLAEAGGVSRSILSNCFCRLFAIVDREPALYFRI